MRDSFRRDCRDSITQLNVSSASSIAAAPAALGEVRHSHRRGGGARRRRGLVPAADDGEGDAHRRDAGERDRECEDESSRQRITNL
jgi:hypothetical protein